MFSTHYEIETNILTIRVEGILESGQEVFLLLKGIHIYIDNFDTKKNMNRLFDLRKLIVAELNSDILQTSAYLLKNFNREYAPIRIADVVASDVMFGEHRALAAFTELPHIDRGVFRSMNAARDWIAGQVWVNENDSAKRDVSRSSD